MADKYQHKEAFCLMQYATKDGKETETLWNSRDGVTPFGIESRTGKEMFHVEWQNDVCVPNFVPIPGMRIFVDATVELITPKLNEYVDRCWDDPAYPASKRYGTKQELFDALLPSWLNKGKAPWIVTTPEKTS